MKLEEIQKMWADDSLVDISNLSSESLKIPSLHSKYYNILLAEKKNLYILVERQERLSFNLESYFAKTMTTEERLELGLPDFPDKRILKCDIQKHINRWEDNVQLKIKIGMQRDKIEFIKDIIKQIHNRSFVIKDAINWIMFQNGQ